MVNGETTEQHREEEAEEEVLEGGEELQDVVDLVTELAIDAEEQEIAGKEEVEPAMRLRSTGLMHSELVRCGEVAWKQWLETGKLTSIFHKLVDVLRLVVEKKGKSIGNVPHTKKK